MSDDARDDARVFIDKLREDNGGITRADREFLAQTKPHILTTLDNIRRKLGASTRALAANLYAKDTRFVYELIQNAEDNKYSIANSSSELPWLTFRLYQDRIVIDSNEDGFSKANIRAICSIGESTKSSIQGYIGEKGIGFKSVFKVAHKVHVQSGPYSFAFEYQRDGNDNGLGMVTPMNEDYLDVPDGVRTRMTLHLLTSCDTAALRKEFLELPDTLLLFLKKLKRLSIHIAYGGFGFPETEKTYSLSSSGNQVSLHTSHRTPSSGLVLSTKKYWTSRRHVINMPSDYARKNINEAEVILAFPLDENDHPVIETQHAFAFLPMRKVGYKFLIQSDFITQASREDVFDSPWNNRLLEEVAETFLHSVVNGFLLHPTLRHHWIRYIPTDSVPDDLWNRIRIKLYQAILSRNLFFSRDNTTLWRANQLRILTPRTKDEDGEPLLPDLVYPGPTAYISDTYDQEIDIPILKSVGLVIYSPQDILDRLAQDLDRFSPRMYSMSPSNQWHTRVADLLIGFMNISRHIEFLKKLPVVPLNNGKWVRPRNATIFFPTSGGIDIPDGLPNLNLVDTSALSTLSRQTLFSKLGVTECQPSRIFPLMEERSRYGGTTLAQSTSYIRFMYWHNDKLPQKVLVIRLAPNYGGDWFNPFLSKNAWTYCPRSEDLYAMSDYIGATVPDQLKDQIKFPTTRYYDKLQVCERRNDKAGIDWFREYFQVRHTPQLYRRDNMQQISSEVEYIAKHQPQSLLGALQTNWHQYRSEWDAYFMSTELPILHSEKLQRLDTTYLPLPKLRSIVSRLGLEEGFGFLKELDDITEHTAGRWAILERFGVVMEENVSFWLALLKKAYKKAGIRIENLFEIYTNLQKFVELEDRRKIRDAFKEEFVLIPPTDSQSQGSWNSLDSCVWNGPEWFTFKHRLGALTQYQDLIGLFRNTLRVSDAGCDDFLAYLQDIKDSRTNITLSVEAKIGQLYEELNEVTKAAWILSPKEKIKSIFDEKKLIYNPGNQSWYGPSSCIWAEDAIQLPGKFSLATTYKRQKSFFLSVLDVTKPNLEMHILALMQKAAFPDKQSIMQEMLNICAFDVTSQAVEKLSDCKCLPVKLPSGEIQWLDRSGIFAIVDRRDYGQLFKGRIKVLDFSLEEVHSLKPLLLALGLGERYLSKAVREETNVEGGSIDEHLMEDLRRKSYAICRYAAHLGSNKVRDNASAMHRTLQNMDVYVSDGISKSVSIRQDGRRIAIPQESAYFHLNQQAEKLNLYIPQSRKHQQVCLSRQLPITLLKHLGVTGAASGKALGSIMTASNLFVVDAILEEDGIIEIEGIERPEDDSELEASDSETTNIPASALQIEASPLISTNSETSNTPVITPQAGSPRQSARVLTPSTPPLRTGISPDLFLSPGASTPATSTFDGLPSSPERPHLYRELLDAVIRQAEGLSNLPMKGRTIEAPIVANWELDTSSAVSSHIPGEREFKIGAAGELFVFELLKGLTLPGFSLENWQSTISYRVAVHERYREIGRWLGSETADIVYEDQNSFLTELLIEKGYLENTVWEGHSPRYYIEVKTTTGSLETPFYCSQLQYDRMERMQLNGAANEVYMIVRVFSLGDSGMGLKVYMDPATLRRDRGLIFKTDKYSVTPGNGR